MDLAAIDLPCPFREVTGLPCPLCGGTRAFVQAVQLHGSFLHYNAVWVFVAVILALVAGAALMVKQFSPARFAELRATAARTPNGTRMAFVIVIFAIAWAWAIAHRATIVS